MASHSKRMAKAAKKVDLKPRWQYDPKTARKRLTNLTKKLKDAQDRREGQADG